MVRGLLSETTLVGSGLAVINRAPKHTYAKIRIVTSHINPLIMKPNKVGISR